MGYYRVDIKGPEGVTSPEVQVYHGDDGDSWGEQGVVISPGGDGNRSHGDPPHKGVH